MPNEFALDGNLRALALPKVLLAAAAAEASGILTLQGEDDIVAVSFLSGSIVTADALNQTVEEGLGKVLQKQKLVTPGDFEAASREHRGGSTGSLGDLLVEKGLLSRAELVEALRIQTVRLMLQLMAWRQGDYKFYSGDEVSHEEGFEPISVSELLVRAVERLGEKAGLVGELPDLETVFRQVPPRSAVQVYARDGVGGAGLWITPDQERLRGAVNGRDHAGELGRRLGLDRFTTQFGIYTLQQFDLVESSGRPAQRPSFDAAPLDASGSRSAPAPAPVRSTAPPLDLAPLDLAPLDDLAPTPSFDEELGNRTPPPEPRRSDGEPANIEIFQPPTPEEIEALRIEEERQRAAAAPSVFSMLLMRWLGPLIAVGLIVATAMVLVERPSRLLLPYPWQENRRATFERQIRSSLLQRIDRGARTFFLMEAHYPDSLSDLERLRLIGSEERRDPAGYSLDYVTDALSYRIRLRDGNQQIEGLGATEAITGDFLVDPQFLRAAARAEAPLVLLD